MALLSAAFEDVPSDLPEAFVESWFRLSVDGQDFVGGPDTRTVMEIELAAFVRSFGSRHWGAFYGIEDDDEAIVDRVTRHPGSAIRTAEALSTYSMIPRLQEPSPPLVIIGIEDGLNEVLLVKRADDPVIRLAVRADRLHRHLVAAIRKTNRD